MCISWYQKICLFCCFCLPWLYHKEMCLYKQGAEMRLVGMFFRVYVRSGDPTTPVCSWRKTEVFFFRDEKRKIFFSLQALPCASACSVPLSVCEESAGKIHTWALLHFTDYFFEVEKSRNTILLLWLCITDKLK